MALFIRRRIYHLSWSSDLHRQRGILVCHRPSLYVLDLPWRNGISPSHQTIESRGYLRSGLCTDGYDCFYACSLSIFLSFSRRRRRRR